MTNRLLREIVRCPNISGCLEEDDKFNACRTIVEIQRSKKLASRQLPEPWSGHLDTAPILFLSSNPSYDEKAEEEYPVGSWADADIEDFFTNRFGGGRKNWIKGGVRFLQKDGSYSNRAVAFWAAVRQRSIELLQREVVPGIDYALSEVVHCKSRNEEGVRDALQECAKRYLIRVISSSPAKVIVVLGELAKVSFADCIGTSMGDAVYGPLNIGSKERFIAFLPHPNARKERRFTKCLSTTDLLRLRSALK